MGYDRKYLVWALFYVVAGMLLGIYMAGSHNHVQQVTHAHILLVGGVLSFVYAVIHKLWLAGQATRLAGTQLLVHHPRAIDYCRARCRTFDDCNGYLSSRLTHIQAELMECVRFTSSKYLDRAYFAIRRHSSAQRRHASAHAWQWSC